MRCSQCKATDTKVIESRDVSEGESIRRRRECLQCKHRFTTYERVETPQLVVVKHNGTRQMYDREKLLAGVLRACEKTSVTAMEVNQLVSDVEKHLYETGDPEVSSDDIGQLLMERLPALSEVAYVRFASVYRRFKDIESFERELSEIKKQTKSTS